MGQAKRKPKYVPRPRIWNAYQVACRLNKSEQWFRDNRERLELEHGFPPRDSAMDGWDSERIERFLDQRGGLASLSQSEGEAEALRILQHGRHQA